MRQVIPDTEEDIKYKEAFRAFLLTYGALKRKRALRWGGRFGPEGASIKVWEHKNNGEIRNICRVKAENTTEDRKSVV